VFIDRLVLPKAVSAASRGEQLACLPVQRLDLVAVDSLKQRLPGREVPVQGADADIRPARDLLEGDVVGTPLGEGLGGPRQQMLVVAPGIGAQRPLRRHTRSRPRRRPHPSPHSVDRDSADRDSAGSRQYRRMPVPT
jgi:hypothetical protein